jgi:hypothetical protein
MVGYNLDNTFRGGGGVFMILYRREIATIIADWDNNLGVVLMKMRRMPSSFREIHEEGKTNLDV